MNALSFFTTFLFLYQLHTFSFPLKARKKTSIRFKTAAASKNRGTTEGKLWLRAEIKLEETGERGERGVSRAKSLRRLPPPSSSS